MAEANRPPPWRSVLCALENERALDLHFRALSGDPLCDDAVPNYKVMKLLALRRQLGAWFAPVVAAAVIGVPALALAQWTAALLLLLVPARSGGATVHLVPSAPMNLDLIEAAAAADPSLRGLERDRDAATLRRLCVDLSPRAVLGAVVQHARLLAHVLSLGDGRRRDLLLHCRDALTLLLLVSLARAHQDQVFITDDHLQRWAWLLSTNAADFRMVRHGILDTGVALPHPFGPLRRLYVRDAREAEAFAVYFQVGDVQVVSYRRPLTPNPIAASAVFLASSFPTIDDEIALLRALKGQAVPTIVKLHPIHRYDGRRRELLRLADLVAGAGDQPACRVFVSHSSSMEEEYRARGIPTFSIARCGGPWAAAQEILAHLDKPDPLA